MYYEIYADSLFLVNLVMNLYCLELVNLFFLRTAACGRILMASVLGAALYLVPFLLPGAAWFKILICFPLTWVAVILTAFRISSLRAFGEILVAFLAASFTFGGALLFLNSVFQGKRNLFPTICGILLAGAGVFLVVSHLIRHTQQEQICNVELTGIGARVKVKGLLDNGNSLVEPISGQPVCILEKSVFDTLWVNGKPSGFRVITYHSVGKKGGVLYGYPVPEMRIEWNGMVRICKNIYIGVSQEGISGQGGYCMIIPPELLNVK